MKAAVIGSNSFSGSDFVDLFLEDHKNQAIGISRSPEKSDLFLPYKGDKEKRFKFHSLDLNRDCERIIEALDAFEPEYIVNFAAQSEVAPSWENPDHWYQTNIVSLSRLTSHLLKKKYLKKYVHISSPEVYGTCEGTVYESAPLNPSTPYAASKAGADLHLFTLVKNFDFPLVMIRATNVYGAHQQLFKIIPRSVINIRLNKKIQLHGGGHAVKSYIHIRDVSEGELSAMLNGEIGNIYHLSPDQGYSVRSVVERIAKQFGKELKDVAVDVEERLGQDKAYVIDSSKARNNLDWKPRVNIEEGLAEVVNWIDSRWSEIKNCPLEYQHIQ